MAITVISTPQAYTPGFNPQFFKASSTQTAQPNFRYRIVLTDLISGATSTVDQDVDLSNFLDFDACGFVRQYLTQVQPCDNYGFQLNTGGIRKIRVNIGEVYGSTPTYYAGSNFDYIVWNGALDFLEFQSYNYTDYIYDRGSSRIRFLSNSKNSGYTYGSIAPSQSYYNEEKTISSKSSFLYCIAAAPGTYNNFQYLSIVGYDEGNNVLSTTNIYNTYSVSGSTYTNQYVYIDVGYDGLANMPSGIVDSGTYPIPVSTFAYYDVKDYSTGVGAGAQTCLIKRFYVTCEPRFDPITIHYLSPEGAFETCLAKKLSLRKSSSNKSYYSKLPYSYGSYNYYSAVEQVSSSDERRSITVNTDWLETYEATAYRDVIASPVVYVDLGDSGGVVSMKVVTNSYTEQKRYNSSMISVSFDLEYSHINIRQIT